MTYHYSKIVRESLFVDSYYENKLFESLNEELDMSKIQNIVSKIKDKKQSIINLVSKFNNEKNILTKRNVGIMLVAIYLIGFAAKNNQWVGAGNYEKIKHAANELVDKKEISTKDVVSTSKKVAEIPEVKVLPIFSLGAVGLIDKINKVVPNRLSEKKIKYYDQYDRSILKAVKKLKEKGETPDADLIKGIMVVETAMDPSDSSSMGYQGFPQTKQSIIDAVNKRNKTNFKMKDMFIAETSAEFIHYYIKGLKESDYVKTTEDVIIAYNWGVGHLVKYKKRKLTLPKESEDYVKMIKVLQKYF